MKKIEKENNKRKLSVSGLASIVLMFFMLASLFQFFTFNSEIAIASTSNDESEEDDYELYLKYENYLKYDKRKKYRQYKEYKEKYKFENKAERDLYKDYYKKYKLYKKNPGQYPQYAGYYEQYKKYKGYKNKYKPYKKYAKYKKYNKAKYNKSSYKKYKSSKYKAGWERYRATLRANSARGEADLGGGSLGPEITVGLWSYSKSQLADDSFRVNANKDYAIKDSSGATIATVSAGSQTRIKRTSGETLNIYHSISDTTTENEVRFEAVNASDEDSIIFTLYPAASSFDEYRGKVKISYAEADNNFWVINTIKLEPYIWGMGEITGTGDSDYNKVMTTAFRTYGYWKIKYSTKYASYGFEVTATSSSQIYYGYDWEKNYSRIKEAAQETRGTIVMYDNRIAITPYSSWTDGRTRSFEERWGSDNYPWCQSVDDSYGKHPTMSTAELVAAGNHMVGISAHGALSLAGDHDWDWQRILNHYFDDIDLVEAY